MKRIALLVVVCTFFCGRSFAQTDLQTVALVRLTRSEPITVKQLKAETEMLVREMLSQQALQEPRPRLPTRDEVNRAIQMLTLDQKRQMLNEMINQRLAIQAAERDRITVSDAELNQQMQQLRDQLRQNLGRAPTDEEFTTAVRNQTGLDVPAFRDQLRRQAIVQKYLMSKKQSVINSAKPPTDAEIQTAYNNNRAEFVRPDTVRFSMIQALFGANPSQADRNRARELIDRLAREIGGSPAKFDEAVMRSQSPNSGYQGGDGGYLPRNGVAVEAVGQDILNTLFSLKQGEVSRVVESPRGYYILMVKETYEFKNLSLDDLAQLGTRVTVREFIRTRMLQQRQMEALARAQQELVNELRAGSPAPYQIFEQYLNW